MVQHIKMALVTPAFCISYSASDPAPAIVPKKAVSDDQVLGPLPPMWETRNGVLDSQIPALAFGVLWEVNQ